MVTSTLTRTVDTCTVRLSHDHEWAELTLSIGEHYAGGKLIETGVDFSGGIGGRDELTAAYTLSNWLAAITSGALYAFRTLKEPRRRVYLVALSGSLRSTGMQPLANATAFAVSNLLKREATILQIDDWNIERTDYSPTLQPVTDSGGTNGVSVDSSRMNPTPIVNT